MPLKKKKIHLQDGRRLKAMMTEKKVSSVVAGVISDKPTPNWAKAQFLWENSMAIMWRKENDGRKALHIMISI